MSLAASWEVIEANDLGPVDGAAELHRFDVVAVAERHDGRLHLVRTELEMTPTLIDMFLERTRGGR